MLKRSSGPLVVAHRGACRQARENTLAAFALARDVGADGIELDVRRSADDVLVVHHDAEAPGLGLLRDFAFPDIRHRAPHIPTLPEVLELCEGWFVNVEVKCLPWERDPDPEHAVVRAVAELVRDFRGDVVVSSFDIGTIDAVRSYAPELSTGYLVHRQEIAGATVVATDRGHPWLHPDRATTLADVDAVRNAHAAGLSVSVWTVDDPEEMRTLAAAGVDAIVTNVPDVARSALTG